MSKFSLTKASAVLIGLSMMATVGFPALAEDSTPSAIKTLRNQAVIKSKLVQEKLESREQNIEDKLSTIREKIASKTAALKLKLQTFKDQNKAKRAEKINDLLNKINRSQTSQMQKHLDKMSKILSKLENRVNAKTPDIKNPEGTKVAIASASAAIASASAAVSAQAEKDYTIEITSENRIAADAKIQRDRLHSDLASTRKLVREAKKAVANAIREAKSMAELKKEATSSGD